LANVSSPPTTPADRLRSDLRHRLTSARKSRDATAVAALRAAIAAIDNAEAPPAPETATSSSARIVGSVLGLRSTEVSRVQLAVGDVLAILRMEVDERATSADEYERLGVGDAAAELRAQADLLDSIVTEWTD
jgi:uncharacterized protein YqeY